MTVAEQLRRVNTRLYPGVYTLEDFLPDCMLPDCPDSVPGATHRHILPKQQEIVEGMTTKYTYVQGGVGGGKTTIIACLCAYFSLTIPKNRGVISRYNYDDLFDSSWRAFRECLERLADKNIIPNPTQRKKTQGEYTEIELHTGSIIKAVQGKNWRRGLGADHGWYWVDDAYECLEDFFIGTDVSAGLLSRLRLPHVRFDARTYHAERREHGSLHGIVSTNPPPINSWLHKLFGSRPGIHRLGGDSITWIQGETGDNPFTGADYARGLMAVQRKMGHSDNVVRRVIFGESIPAYGGIPVFPQFNHRKHVATLKFNPLLPLIRAWDFGFHHPAVIFASLYQCQYRTNHYLALSEVVDCYSATVYELYKNHVKPHTDTLYKDAKLMLDCGDRAGYRNSPSNKDGRGDMKILMHEYNLPFQWRAPSLEPSLQYMRGLLQPKEPCKCGMEHILVNTKCEGLIGALEGGYKYPKPRTGVVKGKPVEDLYFADVACAWRYGAENFVKWGIEWQDEKKLKQQQQQEQARLRLQVTQATPYGWMEHPVESAEMAELLLT